MGTPIPIITDDYELGTPCDACTPGLFPPNKTPKYLYAIFSGIIPCPGYPEPPNGHIFQLEQHPLQPCVYLNTGWLGPYQYHVYFGVSMSLLDLNQLVPGVFFFFRGIEPPCSLRFPTNEYSCGPHEGHSGQAIISLFRPTIPAILCSEYGMMDPRETFSESQDVSIDHVLVRLARLSGSSRIYFYIEREEFPNF